MEPQVIHFFSFAATVKDDTAHGENCPIYVISRSSRPPSMQEYRNETHPVNHRFFSKMGGVKQLDRLVAAMRIDQPHVNANLPPLRFREEANGTSGRKEDKRIK